MSRCRDTRRAGTQAGSVAAGQLIPAPLRLHETTVAPEWVDYNGHLSEWAYLLVFGDSADAFFRYFGVDEGYRAAGRSLYTAETHLRHLARGPPRRAAVADPAGARRRRQAAAHRARDARTGRRPDRHRRAVAAARGHAGGQGDAVPARSPAGWCGSRAAHAGLPVPATSVTSSGSRAGERGGPRAHRGAAADRRYRPRLRARVSSTRTRTRSSASTRCRPSWPRRSGARRSRPACTPRTCRPSSAAAVWTRCRWCWWSGSSAGPGTRCRCWSSGRATSCRRAAASSVSATCCRPSAGSGTTAWR